MDAVQRLRNEGLRERKAETTKEQKVRSGRKTTGSSLPSSPPTPTPSTCRTTIPQSSMVNGHIPSIRRTTGIRRPGYIARGIIATGVAFGTGLCTVVDGLRVDAVGVEHQLGWRRHQHQPRCSRGALAAQSSAPPRSGVQQPQRATKFAGNKSAREQRAAGFSRQRRSAGAEARRGPRQSCQTATRQSCQGWRSWSAVSRLAKRRTLLACGSAVSSAFGPERSLSQGGSQTTSSRTARSSWSRAKLWFLCPARGSYWS